MDGRHLHLRRMRTQSLTGEGADNWNKALRDRDVQPSLGLSKSRLCIFLEYKSQINGPGRSFIAHDIWVRLNNWSYLPALISISQPVRAAHERKIVSSSKNHRQELTLPLQGTRCIQFIRAAPKWQGLLSRKLCFSSFRLLLLFYNETKDRNSTRLSFVDHDFIPYI